MIKLLEIVCKFSSVARYNINFQKSVVFPNTSNNKKLKSTIYNNIKTYVIIKDEFDKIYTRAIY